MDALNAVTAERKTKPRNYDTYRAMKYDLLGLILAALADVKAEIKAAGPVESVKLVDLKSSVLNPAFKNRIFHLKIHKGPKANSTEELWEMVRGKVKPIMLSKALKSMCHLCWRKR